MKFSRWLNALSGVDQLVILSIFILSGFLAWWTLRGVKSWYTEHQKDNPFAKEMRISPLALFAVTLPYSVLIYRMIGEYITSWLGQVF